MNHDLEYFITHLGIVDDCKAHFRSRIEIPESLACLQSEAYSGPHSQAVYPENDDVWFDYVTLYNNIHWSVLYPSGGIYQLVSVSAQGHRTLLDSFQHVPNLERSLLLPTLLYRLLYQNFIDCIGGGHGDDGPVAYQNMFTDLIQILSEVIPTSITCSQCGRLAWQCLRDLATRRTIS
jgi:hypothetical protein